jgi:hypothetical protein
MGTRGVIAEIAGISICEIGEKAILSELGRLINTVERNDTRMIGSQVRISTEYLGKPNPGVWSLGLPLVNFMNGGLVHLTYASIVASSGPNTKS